MSSQHLPVAPVSRAAVEAELESCHQMVQRFSTYCDELLQSVESYAKYLQKKKGKRKVKDPVIIFPPRPSGRASLNISNLLGDTVVLGAGARGGLPPIASEDETVSTSTDRTTRGDRTRRAAALKAREGYMVAFQGVGKKLRRPTNFDPRSGPSLSTVTESNVRRALDLSKVQQANEAEADDSETEEIFKRPALPIPAVDSRKTARPTRSRATRNTTSRDRNDVPVANEEEPEGATSRPSRATRNKTQVMETENSDGEVPPPPRASRSTRARTTAQPNETFQVQLPESSEEVAPRPSRSTRTKTKAQLNEPIRNTPPESSDEEVAPRRSRSRTKTKAQPNETFQVPAPGPAADAASPLPTRPSRSTRTLNNGHQDGVNNSNLVVPKDSAQPSKSGESSKAAQQPRSTFVIPNEEAPTDEEDICDQSTDEGEGMDVDGREGATRPTVLEGSQRPRSNPEPQAAAFSATTVLRKRRSNGVNDPMETLDFPEDMSPEKESKRGSFKRHNEESEGGPAVKRGRSAEDLSGVRAPRTRSKARQLMTAPAESSRSGSSNKENTIVLPINQMMKVLAEKPTSRTPGKTAPKPGNSKVPKKEKDDALRKKEEEALKKKQELMNQKKEEIRKNRETKVKKVAESRAAVEKEKMLQLEKEKKEREEKERQAMAELHRKKEEELLKKKLINQQKAQEAEERRIREEKMRLARLKEQEEEQRRVAEARQRQLEEAERLAALRKAQEKEEEQLRALEKERREREKARVARAVPAKDDPDDIGIDDSDGDDSPRRPIPKWAEPDEINAVLKLQSYYGRVGVPVHAFFEVAPAFPNLKEIFGNDALPRQRTSSQFWPKTPPHPGSNSDD